MITLDQYWKGPDAVRRDVTYAADMKDEYRVNAEHTVATVNKLLARYEADTGQSVYSVNSGWRPPSVNEATRNAATGSTHLTAEGIDLYDPNGDLDKWCLANLGVLVELGLWQEHPGWTDGWCHLQTCPPRRDMAHARVRVYIPSSQPPQTMAYGREPRIVEIA